MRRVFWLLAVFLAFSTAQPMWQGNVVLSATTASVTVNVTGTSPLAMGIPATAKVTGANYSNGTAVFNKSFSYTYRDPRLIADSGGEKVFLFAFDQPAEFNYSLSVILPPTAAVISASPPADYFTDGKLIGAKWNGTASQKQFVMRYDFQESVLTRFVQTDIPIVDKTMFLPGIILAFLLGYFLAAGTATALLQRIRHITANMSDEEKSIVYLLHNGPMEQSKIQKKLNFSKAKLSRTLRSMEERKIIEKTPKGKTNVISLK